MNATNLSVWPMLLPNFLNTSTKRKTYILYFAFDDPFHQVEESNGSDIENELGETIIFQNLAQFATTDQNVKDKDEARDKAKQFHALTVNIQTAKKTKIVFRALASISIAYRTAIGKRFAL